MPLPVDDWVLRQQELAAPLSGSWMGTWAPYDAPAARLARADNRAGPRLLAGALHLARGAAITGEMGRLVMAAHLALPFATRAASHGLRTRHRRGRTCRSQPLGELQTLLLAARTGRSHAE